MNTFCYILGSGIMDKPYAIEIAISICVMVMFGFLAWYGFNRAASVGKKWMFWCAFLCVGIAIIVYLLTCYFFVKSVRVNEKKQEPFEKVEYKDYEIIHNPDCSFSKIVN